MQNANAHRLKAYLFAIAVGTPVPILLLISLAGFPSRTHHSLPTLLAWYGFAAFISGVNFYFSHVRGWLWLRRHRSPEGYQHVSGMPLIGSIAIGIAAIGTWGDPVSAAIGLVLCFIDTGGGTWFLITCIRTRGFES